MGVDDELHVLPFPSFSSGREPTATTARFVAGPENRLAVVAVQRLLPIPLPAAGSVQHQHSAKSAEITPRPDVPSFSLFGPSGCGKTHLARGLVDWMVTLGHQAVYTTADDFVRDLALARQTNELEAFRASHREIRLLAIDDVHRLTPREAVQEELIHTFDALSRYGGLIIVTANVFPASLQNLPPALRSRLLSGLAVPLALPGESARRQIVRQLAQSRQESLSESEVAAIAAEPGISPRGLWRRLLERVNPNLTPSPDPHHAQQQSCPPTLRRISSLVARYYGLTLKELKGRSRKQTVAEARGVAMLLSRQLTPASLSTVGREYSGRDHTTVIHACRKTALLQSRDSTVRDTLADLRRLLSTG